MDEYRFDRTRDQVYETKNGLSAVTFSRDSRRLAVAGARREAVVRVWNLDTDECAPVTLKEPALEPPRTDKRLLSVAVAADLTRLTSLWSMWRAAGFLWLREKDSTGCSVLQDCSSPGHVRIIAPTNAHKVIASRDGRRIALTKWRGSSASEASTQVLDFESAKALHEIPGDAMSLSPDGRFLLVSNGELKLLDIDAGEVSALPLTNARVAGAHLTADTIGIAANSGICTMSLDSRTVVRRFLPDGASSAIAVSDDGTRLASAYRTDERPDTRDEQVVVHAHDQRAAVAMLRTRVADIAPTLSHHEVVWLEVGAMAWSPDGLRLAVNYYPHTKFMRRWDDAVVVLWDMESRGLAPQNRVVNS